MMRNRENREKIKQDLILKVGPWAFQSYSKAQWMDVSDKELICGSLLRGKPQDRFQLLDIYSVDYIKSIWEKFVLKQDNWFHDSNVWVAKNLFNAVDPERFIRSKKRHMKLWKLSKA